MGTAMQSMTDEQRKAFERGRTDWKRGRQLERHNPYWLHETGYLYWQKGWLEEDDFTIVTTLESDTASHLPVGETSA